MTEFCCHTEAPDAAARQFVELVKKGQSTALRSWLEEHQDLPPRIDQPWFAFDAPAIVVAAGQGDRHLLEVLLEFGADINARSRWWAGGFGVLDNPKVLDNNAELAAFLIERGGRVDVHAAAGLGDLQRLERLLGDSPDLIHARGGDGQLPLHCAANPEIAGWLLDRGARIDARDLDHRSSAAQYAVDDRPEVCRFLVERGARADLLMAAALGDLALAGRLLTEDPSCIGQRVGKAPFPAMTDPVKDAGHIYQWKLRGAKWPQQVAKAFGHEPVWELLMDHSPPTDQLVMACWFGDRSRLDQLEAAHPRLAQQVGAADRGLLVQAAWDGKTEAVRRFLDLGFDIDTFAGDGTALDRAAVHGNIELIELLLGRGASTEIRNVYGGSPAGAALWGMIHFRDGEGNYPTAVRRLLEAQQIDSGDLASMLRWAASEGGLEAVRLLVEEGASTTAVDKQGRNALSLARQAGQAQIVELLETVGESK